MWTLELLPAATDVEVIGEAFREVCLLVWDLTRSWGIVEGILVKIVYC